MLDTLNVNNNKVVFNSVSGTIMKSSERSVIVRAHIGSPLAKDLFEGKDAYVRSAVVLQVMLCGDDQFLIEYIKGE